MHISYRSPLALKHDLPVDDSAESGYGGERGTASPYILARVYRWQAANQYTFGPRLSGLNGWNRNIDAAEARTGQQAHIACIATHRD